MDPAEEEDPGHHHAHWVTVKLRVTNIGDDARSFSATNQKLIINGNEYEATSIMDDSWMEDINPGLGIEAVGHVRHSTGCGAGRAARSLTPYG